MHRKTFIKQTGTALLGIGAFPYILPTGRLFAPTGHRMANHVVFCLFAGGIRNFESIEMKDGNLMPNILSGSQSISGDIKAGIDVLPASGITAPIQQSGTLFRGFRYNSHVPLHYSAHAAAMTGVYSNNFELMKPLIYPSIFEYYRKHTSPAKAALNAWWVTDQAGPFPFLNYSDYPGYGPQYGANMLQPTSFFNPDLSSLRSFSKNENRAIATLQAFFKEYAQIPKDQLSKHQIENSTEDKIRIERFLQVLNDTYIDPAFDPWGVGNMINEDLSTMYAATKILSEFKPELLVVNMQHSDIGHSDFTKYCNNMHKADFATAQLWKTIQQTPGLKDDTVLIIAPEFGRNLKPNTLIDKFGRFAIDHNDRANDNDENTSKIFCLIAGPDKIVRQNKVINETVGETIDIVPTIAEILGFSDKTDKSILKGRFLNEAFV